MWSCSVACVRYQNSPSPWHLTVSAGWGGFALKKTQWGRLRRGVLVLNLEWENKNIPRVVLHGAAAIEFACRRLPERQLQVVIACVLQLALVDARQGTDPWGARRASRCSTSCPRPVHTRSGLSAGRSGKRWEATSTWRLLATVRLERSKCLG